jgi:hypothetical protein
VVKRRATWTTVCAVVVLLGLFQGTAMAKMVIWSAMKGRVLMNGQPAVGAVLKREFNWGWKDENGSDQATTGAGGEFSLPSIERSSFLGGILPHEPVIRQVITVTWQGKSYDAWAYFKRDYDNNGENGGRPIVVTCRLEAERVKHGDVMGLCEFD